MQEARYGITKCTNRISNIREAVQIRREQLIGIEFKHQIAEAIFNALKPIYFDLLRYIPEKSNLVNIVKNNYGATLKYKILDGYVKPVTFSNHTTPLYLIFLVKLLNLGQKILSLKSIGKICIFQIAVQVELIDLGICEGGGSSCKRGGFLVNY